ncbi:MAG: class I SAM-dependent methyltransferase [Nitrospira sp.]|nr:class I SAM-dependent methyltransferase [Nitrospira sp.]
MKDSEQSLDLSKVASLYNARFDEYGSNVKTVGWGNESSQYLRFDVLFRGLDPKGRTILDVGCGLGGLIPYLERHTGGDFRYIGVDIAEKLIGEAAAKYGGTGRDFYVGDIHSVTLPPVDIAVLSGALSFKAVGVEEYAYGTMERMYALSRKAASLNFLTKYVDYELDKNQHYQPEMIFSKARQITRYVNLIHDYPLYEFTVQLLKSV